MSDNGEEFDITKYPLLEGIQGMHHEHHGLREKVEELEERMQQFDNRVEQAEQRAKAAEEKQQALEQRTKDLAAQVEKAREKLKAQQALQLEVKESHQRERNLLTEMMKSKQQGGQLQDSVMRPLTSLREDYKFQAEKVEAMSASHTALLQKFQKLTVKLKEHGGRVDKFVSILQRPLTPPPGGARMSLGGDGRERSRTPIARSRTTLA